jgi:GNAT superfamily N-acetyltransferase
MKLSRIAADLAREEDADRILEANRLEYGADDMLATPADFAWRHDQNPAGQAIIPVIRDDQGEVVGFIWVVPIRVRVRGRDYLVATGTNLVIHPEHRNGLGNTKLLRRFQQVFKDHGIALHFSFVSEDTYRRRQEQAPQTVSSVSLLVRPLEFETLTQTYSADGWQRFIIKGVGPLVSPFLLRKQSPASAREISVQAVKQFTQDFDKFWDENRDKYPVMAIRDRAYLSWRFAPVSARQYYLLIARSGEQTLGYAVLRNCTIRGLKTGLIMDLLVADGPLGERAGAHLMAEAETYFRSRDVSVAAGLVPRSAPEYRVLRRAGYVGLPQALAPRVFRFAFFVHSTDDTDLMSLSAREWFVTLADYESF